MRQPERFLQAGLAGDQAMMLQQRGFAVLQRYRDMLRQLAGAEGGIGRAGDRIPAGRGDHIVDGRDGPVEDRHRRTMDSVIVDHRLGIGPRLVGRLMKTPFAGGQFSLLMLAVGINKDDLVFRQLFIRDTGGGDQHSSLIAHADIAGGPLI